METTLSKIAAQIRAEKAAEDKAEKTKMLDKMAAACNTLLKSFEGGFEKEIPLLKEAGITYSAHFNSVWDHEGSYIEFAKGDKILKMDFSNGLSYRYEYTGKSGSEGSMGTMIFGNWDKDRFLVWIDDNLLK